MNKSYADKLAPGRKYKRNKIPNFKSVIWISEYNVPNLPTYL